MARRIPAQPVVETLRGLPSRLSLVWLLPLAAILIAAYVLLRTFLDRGPLIEIRFESAGGVIAGETRILRRDVNVGRVEAVRLGEDLDSVVVQVRLDPQVSKYIDSDTRFWIVNARINTTEISGLGTLLTGAYIEVDWDDVPGEKSRKFEGLQEPPLTKRGTPGTRVTLNAEESGYIVVGSPVFLRQIEVGRVERRRLRSDGKQVLFDLFIAAPYHLHIYPNTRFFAVSGVEAQVSSDGVSVRIESLSALFTGGVAFENSDDTLGSEPILRDGSKFKLFDSRSAARDSVFEGDDDQRFRYIAEFVGSVKGLKKDAPIEFNGLQVGRVVRVAFEPTQVPGQRNRIYAVLQFQPRRLGMPDVTPESLLDTLQGYIDSGMRVQLATGNILTGSLIVKLVEKPNLPAAQINLSAIPYPSLPTLPSDIEAVTADVETLVQNLSKLPLDSLVATATEMLSGIARLVSSREVENLPKQLSASLASITTVANRVEQASADLPELMKALSSASRNADEVLQGLSPDSEIYIELSAAARELRIAAKSIAAFAELLEENPNAVLTGR